MPSSHRPRPPAGTVTIKGSSRRALAGARVVGSAESTEPMRVSLYARQNPATRIERSRITAELSWQLPKQRHYIKGGAFDSIFGADPEDVKRITSWAEGKGFKVAPAPKAASRRIVVEGDVATVDQAFSTSLSDYEHPTLGRFRGREGPLRIDQQVYGLVEGVFGLDTRPVGRPRGRRLDTLPLPWRSAVSAPKKLGGVRALPANPWPGTFFPPQVASVYKFPLFTGSGQNVAVFAFNGGNTGDPHGGYSTAALNTYFTQVLGGSMPQIQDVVVQGPGNFPGPDTPASDRQGDATGEVMLDLCVVGSLVPAANIFVYFTEFTTQGWIDALHQAITDQNDIAVISISYGNPEDDPQGAWTPMGVKLVDQALQAAVAKGITICVSSGDDGSGDGEQTGAHVDFPASSPFVLAVGGTKLVASGTAVQSETVWNEIRIGEGAGGGGISAIFSRPDYQDGTNIPPSVDPPHRMGRGLPDVSAVADPETGVVVMHIDGTHLEPIGGTSASTPLWASLIARVNQGIGTRCGFLNPILYTKLNKGVLRDITQGSNGAYSASVGWDACTGFGSPGGAALFKALSATGNKSAAAKAARRR